MAGRDIWVRVREYQQQFQKDLIEYDNREGHKKDPGKRFRIGVHGYDELGRGTCPLFLVPDCKEIQDAIHNDLRRDPRSSDDKERDPEGFIVPSRLVHVLDTDADRFPKYIGHPTVDMTPEQVYDTVMKIRAEQIKGDEVMGEKSKPYTIRKPAGKESESFTFDNELWKLFEAGEIAYKERQAAKKADKELAAVK